MNRFLLPNLEYVSCVLWGGLYQIAGINIVRALVFRFKAFGCMFVRLAPSRSLTHWSTQPRTHPWTHVPALPARSPYPLRRVFTRAGAFISSIYSTRTRCVAYIEIEIYCQSTEHGTGELEPQQ
ncbi:uncharacterized protein C8Q71DRAFT_716574 [Rhodofomes roseus]|uniref:Uncharacterized protein n=1 Tax=Rhodofomes roseus TaxID=34475 RepID=A0ABQ8K2E3_9APHY|nr:uncharacterized protein C8Q71DRAFT_716528 [Rhodofomes roseus]XP_047773930.1 uncharacterized protein C8Q71DRAFT_716574 [Rhodofomes roseus]KAH9830633.1 hypothetical protein C8Q71DRAFT_716528 [Rhodofomes roseus]KAH9830635.1 hypothetical protein C8Q71DRAFT_716574 [Rhodofomes roseus]